MRRYPLVLIVTGALFLAAAGAAVVVGAPAARAGSEPGSGFRSLNLSALGGGARVLLTHDGTAEADVPYAEATMRTGPLGRALSSVTWPGAVAANLGSTLVLIGNPVPGGPPYPDQVNEALGQANYPVRAEAGSGSGPSTVKNDSVPGAVMTAHATQEKTSAEARLGGAEAPGLGKVGATRSVATTKLTGATSAVSQARSVVNDVTLAGGEVTIGSVASAAKATTNGNKAAAAGRTYVTDMKVAGVPVTVDEDGVHVAGQGTSGEQAREAVDQALAETGFEILLSQPTGAAQGGAASYDAGSLIIAFPQDGPTITLGGARVHVSAAAGSPFSSQTGTVPTDTPPATEAAPPAQTSGGGAGSVSAPSVGAAAASDGGSDGGAAEAELPTIAGAQATQPVGRLAPGVSPAWITLAVVGALLVMAGAVRLPDRLVQATAAPCAHGDQ